MKIPTSLLNGLCCVLLAVAAVPALADRYGSAEVSEEPLGDSFQLERFRHPDFRVDFLCEPSARLIHGNPDHPRIKELWSCLLGADGSMASVLRYSSETPEELADYTIETAGKFSKIRERRDEDLSLDGRKIAAKRAVMLVGQSPGAEPLPMAQWALSFRVDRTSYVIAFAYPEKDPARGRQLLDTITKSFKFAKAQ